MASVMRPWVITGRFEDSDGTGCAGATIHVNVNGGQVKADAVTDANGNWLLGVELPADTSPRTVTCAVEGEGSGYIQGN